MGLDTIAYEHVEKVDEPKTDEELDDFYDNGGILISSKQYKSERIYPLEPGHYIGSGKTFQTHSSYGGHSMFRNSLTAMFGHTQEQYWAYANPEWPFIELVDFSDCEGVLGPVACENLAKDFNIYRDQYISANDKWDISLYDDWSAAVNLAAGTGAIHFH